MASKFSNRFLMICSTLAAAGGCSQILGISDYDIDPKLDMSNGSSSAGEGGSGDTGSSGKTSSAGKTNTGGAGDTGGSGGSGGRTNTAGTSNGGQAPNEGGAGGEPPVVNVGGAGSGAGGEAGAGGAPLEVVPCDSADCCTLLGGIATGVELLQDGGFELGPPDLGSSPWLEDSTLGIEAISEFDEEIGFTPKVGTYFTYLSGLPGESTSIFSEDVLVPPDAGWMVVSGWRWFQIDAQDGTNTDVAYVALNSSSGAEELPLYWTAPASDTDGWGDTPSWRTFEASWDAIPHQGETRYLVLHGESDSYPVDESSAYLFDEVSLKYYRCYK